MVRHPHILTVAWTSAGEYNASGYYVPGTTVTHDIKGRAEANGKGSLVRTPDGAQIVYEWSFYTSTIQIDIPHGADAELVHNTGTWRGTFKRAAVNQKGTQIWL